MRINCLSTSHVYSLSAKQRPRVAQDSGACISKISPCLKIGMKVGIIEEFIKCALIHALCMHEYLI